MSIPVRRYGLFDFADYIEQRVAHFTGRDWVFQELDLWLANPASSRYYLLTGEPGSGKSAVAARLSQFSLGEVAQPDACRNLTPGFLRAVHFCSTTASNWIDPLYFARSIALQLSSLEAFKRALVDVGNKVININVQQTATVQSGGSVTGVRIENLTIQGLNGQEAFNSAVLDPLRSIYQAGFDQPIAILIDALDEALAALTTVKIVDLLAGVQGLDDRVRFILTSRPDPKVDNRFPSADGTSLSDPDHNDENNRDVRRFVENRLQRDDSLKEKAAGLPSDKLATLLDDISSRADGNFQYVTFLLKAVAAGQQLFGELAGLPAGLDGLYHESLRRVIELGTRDWVADYLPFLGVLSVAREPLTLKFVEACTASSKGLWNVYTDLIQFVETAPGNTPPRAGSEPENRYRLYHQSVIDFLHEPQLTVVRNGQKKTLANTFFVEPSRWHGQIVSSCTKSATEWSQVDWSSVPQYALRHLVAHLYQLQKNNGYSDKLHALLGTRPFVDRHLAVLGKPYLLLGDIRLALRLALDQDNLPQAWKHIREYRRVLRDQLDFQQLESAVETANATGDYVHVTERTILYGYMPNSQALARLWIAWNAAASGHKKEAENIVKATLAGLRPRGLPQDARFMERSYGATAADPLDEALQHLLVRIAEAAEDEPGSQGQWLRQTMSPWPKGAVDSVVERLSESWASWGEFMHAAQMTDPIEAVFKTVEEMEGRLLGDRLCLPGRRNLYYFQEQLSAGLFNSQDHPGWLEYVKRAVALIALDDYPSYREIALAWITAAVLAQENPVLARQALAAVLGGMFRPSPGFWGDTVAAAMDRMDLENNQGPNPGHLGFLLEHLEATGEQGVDPTVMRKLEDVMEWRRKMGLPTDPWSFGMRRRSAVSAVLKRRGDLSGAETLLREASAQPDEGSYAGFRALARLSLACRWLEWRHVPDALEEISVAENDASNVLDKVLRQERLDLVSKMRGWITDYCQNAAVLSEGEGLSQLQWKSGLERGLFIEILSALWFGDAPRLKRLLPFALDDATTADAVLGRLVGAETLQVEPGRPFLQLVKALEINSGVERV
ncbi:MAG: hypothetical protein EHM61_16070 [Acidobacteria bacterium]|nr:MAG: hypothetical protein EHM61_16070 [Acidobacteriota bacterium]